MEQLKTGMDRRLNIVWCDNFTIMRQILRILLSRLIISHKLLMFKTVLLPRNT